MKTYNKLLAVACITCCTNVHADNINWEEVSHFFNFDTIAEEKRTHLATNIQLLVEEQLKLPSGQNLWKAFQFWQQQHPELGFQFEFTLTANPGAEVILESLKNSFEVKEIFCFEVLINKLFAEKLEADQILSENMLYRPCLIKLVDSDDPEKWEYHLREQELPFFITLAHEFLHALNQLEKIDWILESLGMRRMEELFKELNLNKFDVNNFNLRVLCLFNKGKINKEKLKDFYAQFKEKFDNYIKKEILFSTLLEAILPTKIFLAKKLKLSDKIGILDDNYLDLWGNRDNDDFLDEMTVILQSKRKVAFGKNVYIGESTFLQEYYHDDSIVSWSHYSAKDHKFWENMAILLGKNYVDEVCIKFNLKESSFVSIYVDNSIEKFNQVHYKVGYSKRESTKQQIQSFFSFNAKDLNNVLIILEIPSGNQEIYIQWNLGKIRTLPKYMIINKK